MSTKSKWSKSYWSDLAERVGATFVATLIPVYITTVNVVHLDWVNAIEISASAAGLSLLKGLLANLKNSDSGPSLLPSPPAPPVPAAEPAVQPFVSGSPNSNTAADAVAVETYLAPPKKAPAKKAAKKSPPKPKG